MRARLLLKTLALLQLKTLAPLLLKMRARPPQEMRAFLLPKRSPFIMAPTVWGTVCLELCENDFPAVTVN